MTRPAWIAVGVAVVVLASTGIGWAFYASRGGEPITSGRVVGKQFVAAHDETVMIPIYGTTCSGKPTICTTHLITMIPTTDHHADAWRLRVESCAEKCRQGWIKVSESEYDGTTTGMQWEKQS